MMYLPLLGGHTRLWVIGVFMRVAKVILLGRVHRNDPVLSNPLDDCGNVTEIDLSPCATYVPDCA